MRRFSTFARVSLVETTTVDEIDRQLTQCLGVDGRASFAAIAEVLGVSDQTVARRYRRLRSAGALRVVGLKYPKSAGYANWFLRLRCVPGSGEAIAAALAQRPTPRGSSCSPATRRCCARCAVTPRTAPSRC